jgi:hypothetical protein
MDNTKSMRVASGVPVPRVSLVPQCLRVIRLGVRSQARKRKNRKGAQTENSSATQGWLGNPGLRRVHISAENIQDLAGK